MRQISGCLICMCADAKHCKSGSTMNYYIVCTTVLQPPPIMGCHTSY